jgi:uncharacterized membrane protein
MANARNYFHRGIVVSICVVQIFTLYLKSNTRNTDGFVFWMPLVLLFLLVLGFACTGIYTISECIKFWRSAKLVDMPMKIRDANLLTKPE